MSTAVRVLCIALVYFLLASTVTACEPCNDPSQIWCPDEW